MLHPHTQLPELVCVGGALCEWSIVWVGGATVNLRSRAISQMHNLDPGRKHFTCVGLPLHQLTLGPTHPHWGVALKVAPMISHLIASGCKGVETAFNLVLLEGELWMVVC